MYATEASQEFVLRPEAQLGVLNDASEVVIAERLERLVSRPGRALGVERPELRRYPHAWKLLVHLFSDFSLILVQTLAPFGFVLSRRPDGAAFLVAWTVLAFALTVVSGFGGARLRAPIEPQLMPGASVVLAGDWRPPCGYAQRYHKALLEEILSGRHARLGDAIAAAQAAYAQSGAFPELLSIYHLLGDPASKLR